MPIGEEQAIALLGLVFAASLVGLVVMMFVRRSSLITGFLGAMSVFCGLGYAFFRAITSTHVLEGEIAGTAISIVLGALGIFVVIGTIISTYAACVRSMRHTGIRVYNLLGLVALLGGLAYLVSWPLLNGIGALFDNTPSRNAFLAVLGVLVLLCVLFASYVMACALNMGSSFGRRYDAIIALGDELRHDHRLQWALAKRVDKAVKKLRRCPDAVLVMSGAQAYDEDESRARAMAEYALLWEVPPERILLDELSETTEESIANSLELVRAFRAGEIVMELDEEGRLVYGQMGEEIPSYAAEFEGVEAPNDAEEEDAPEGIETPDVPETSQQVESSEQAEVSDDHLPRNVLLVTTNCELLSAMRAAARLRLGRLGIRVHGVGTPCGPFTFLGRFGVQWFETLFGLA